jgi:hypothetical protein
MDEPREEPLPGTGFTLDEDRRKAPTGRLAIQQVAQLLPKGVDGWAMPEQFSQRFHGRLAYAPAQVTAQISEQFEQ